MERDLYVASSGNIATPDEDSINETKNNSDDFPQFFLFEQYFSLIMKR